MSLDNLLESLKPEDSREVPGLGVPGLGVAELIPASPALPESLSAADRAVYVSSEGFFLILESASIFANDVTLDVRNIPRGNFRRLDRHWFSWLLKNLGEGYCEELAALPEVQDQLGEWILDKGKWPEGLPYKYKPPEPIEDPFGW